MIRLALSSDLSPLLAVLGTYLLHSTLFFAVVWLLGQVVLRRHPAAANLAWRLALVVPLASTALVLALPPRLAMVTAHVDVDSGGEAAAGGEADRRFGDSSPGVTLTAETRARAATGPGAAGRLGEAGPVAASRGLAERVRALGWRAGLLLLLAIALGRLLWLAGRVFAFRRGLRGRTLVQAGIARERLDTLCVHAGLTPVTLTVSSRVTVPLAMGALRPEICLPHQALEGLPPAELEAVLAHELAHVERGDNRWLTAASVLEAALSFQPLLALVRRRLQDSAELACDQRAVELTGSARALARSLAEVAAWNLGGEPAVPVSAMAHRGSLLLRRVQSLLADAAPVRRLGRGHVRVLLCGLAALAVFLPGLGGIRALPGMTTAPGMMVLAPSLVESAVAAPSLPPTVPKATAAADRLKAAPVRAPRDHEAAPPPVMPPLPPLDHLLPPVAEMVAGVVEGVLPRAMAAAGQLGPLAAREAQLEMRLDALEDRKGDGRATKEELAELPGLRAQVTEVRKQLEEAERQLERDMEAWGQQFERGPGKDFEMRMEKWGEQYGRHMKKWGEVHGKQWERWGTDLARRFEQRPHPVPRSAPAPVPKPTPNPLPKPPVRMD